MINVASALAHDTAPFRRGPGRQLFHEIVESITPPPRRGAIRKRRHYEELFFRRAEVNKDFFRRAIGTLKLDLNQFAQFGLPIENHLG